MKTLQLISLFLCFLFCFVGCGQPETPTDVSEQTSSSAVEESATQTVVQNSQVESLTEPASMANSANAASSLVKGSSSAVENETETSEVKEKKKITYSKWDSAQEGSHYIQTTESTSKQIGFSLICNSYEDWCSFLDSGKVLYNVREADQEKMENGYRQRYPKSYFDQGKSLLLFSIASGSGSINATVKEMWLENDWDLNVEVDVRYPFFYTGDVVSKLYIAEVEDPLQSIQTIKVKANCLKGDSDGSFQQTESAVYVYSVQ